jgi:hypothetical protein
MPDFTNLISWEIQVFLLALFGIVVMTVGLCGNRSPHR